MTCQVVGVDLYLFNRDIVVRRGSSFGLTGDDILKLARKVKRDRENKRPFTINQSVESQEDAQPTRPIPALEFRDNKFVKNPASNAEVSLGQLQFRLAYLVYKKTKDGTGADMDSIASETSIRGTRKDIQNTITNMKTKMNNLNIDMVWRNNKVYLTERQTADILPEGESNGE